MRSMCNIWLILQHFRCAHHPESSGLVERTNGTIKIQLAKISKVFNLPWPKAVPVMLLKLRSTPFGKPSLSP